MRKLIYACKRSGVTDLKFGDVYVKFGPGEAVQTDENAVDPKFSVSADELKAEEKSALVRMNVEHAEDQLSLMQLENPVLFEQLLAEKELENLGAAN